MKECAVDILNFMKMAERSSKGWESLWERRKNSFIFERVNQYFQLFPRRFHSVKHKFHIRFNRMKYCSVFKGALQILGRKSYNNTKKSSLYSQSLLIFIHKTPVVENHLTTREIRELLWPRSTPTGNTVYFYESRSLIYKLEIHRSKFQT